MAPLPSWIASVDLTSLDRAKETAVSVAALCATAIRLSTACVCVHSERVAEAIAAHVPVVATVVNFPDGNETEESVKAETLMSIAAGASEIDVVWNYKAFLAGDVVAAIAPVRWVVDALEEAKSGAAVKVIIETGAIPSEKQREASDAIIACIGTDVSRIYYLKTSTGKNGYTGATVEAATAMLDAIQAKRLFETVGLKVSGGVRTVEIAVQFQALAGKYGCKHFRIGASSLLDGF
ncbi:hypothetical protein BC830DRAFT_1158764 [Chytriomyces sp. MP71]|nr:hypothetical protein BC830DRAFT_1158764 [Chytriomyces sp. MP71]